MEERWNTIRKCFQIFRFDVVLDKSGVVPSGGEFQSEHVHRCRAQNDQEAAEHHPASLVNTACASTESVAGQSVYMQRQRGGAVCMCKDSHEPHCHRVSPVDLAVKSKVLKGALQLILPEYQSAEMERGYRAARDRTEEDSLVVDHESLDETYEASIANISVVTWSSSSPTWPVCLKTL